MPLTYEKLLNYLDTEMGLDISEIDDETLLFSTALLDSFSLVELITFIEKEANIKISPTEVNLDNLDSVSRILNFVEHHS
ncbi:acyl carrier protein [Candidatus Parabeggiatoa sp. HSG14]|uniref:acyl carrier protein n=1 Tax=Candidatus Parabeggiatoa sp. HSG14 TaxID=3055593 RepID=UPI0025A8F442|nr:acyl carrier protein [Thiotrichales bacterium HSG14]